VREPEEPCSLGYNHGSIVAADETVEKQIPAP
jgi:hypothetical protein